MIIMLSIREKLDKFHSKSMRSNSFDRNKQVDASVVQGEEVQTPHGGFILRQKTFPLSFDHGVSLQEILRFNRRDWVLLAKSPEVQQLNPHNIAVVDTETTGLAGGAGTLAFMIGIGRITANSIVIKQYFMRDFSDEATVLEAVGADLAAKTGIVSFNGKAYDFSVLRNRYVMNRKAYPFEHLLHLDFLHTARRLWKARVGTCTLQNLEMHILRFQRQGDIPGSEIPARYFEFLKSKNLNPLLPVFQHNCIDILSLFSLLIKARACFMPGQSVLPIYTGLIKTLHDLGFYRKADFIFNRALAEAPPHIQAEIHYQKSMNLKKIGNWQKAAAIWKQLIEQNQRFDPRVYIELAKYYEHQTGDAQKALHLIEQLQKRLDIAAELHADNVHRVDRHELLHRKKRLSRKEKNKGDQKALSGE